MQLDRHSWRLQKRLDEITEQIRPHEVEVSNISDLYKVERAIMQLQIEWEHFVRAVILDSAVGRHSTRSGLVRSRLPYHVRNRRHASRILIEQYPRRRHEPDWYLPRDAIQAASLLSLTNENQISTELGVTPWELDDLRHLRNFIAHRSDRAAISVRAASNVTNNDRIEPSRICFEYTPGGLRRYEKWTNFMKGVAHRIVS